MSAFPSLVSRLLLVLLAAFSISGCGLVRAPFRVAGALGHGAYQGGKKAVKASSSAIENRKERKAKEKAKADEKAKAAADQQQQQQQPKESMGPLANPPAEGPIIPLPETAPLPPPN
jgi:hypothetical protein